MSGNWQDENNYMRKFTEYLNLPTKPQYYQTLKLTTRNLSKTLHNPNNPNRNPIYSHYVT